jgi:hypothetical protein
MKNRFHVVDVTEEPNLTLTRQQQDMRNRGLRFRRNRRQCWNRCQPSQDAGAC